MGSLDGTLGGDGPSWRSASGVLAVIGGVTLAGIGTLSVSQDIARPALQDGIADPVAAILTAAILSGLLLAAVAVLDGPCNRRRLAVGTVLAVGGALAGSGGALLFVPGVLATGAGFTVLVAEVLRVAIVSDETAAAPRLELRPSGAAGGAPATDGGADDDLQFPLDDEDEQLARSRRTR